MLLRTLGSIVCGLVLCVSLTGCSSKEAGVIENAEEAVQTPEELESYDDEMDAVEPEGDG